MAWLIHVPDLDPREVPEAWELPWASKVRRQASKSQRTLIESGETGSSMVR